MPEARKEKWKQEEAVLCRILSFLSLPKKAPGTGSPAIVAGMGHCIILLYSGNVGHTGAAVAGCGFALAICSRACTLRF